MMRFCGHLTRLGVLSAAIVILVFRPLPSHADGPLVGVQLDTAKASPRAVESETEHRIVSDYRLAWTNIARAMESNTRGPLQALFVGPAKKWLDDSVSNQQKSGMSSRYLNQNHRLQAVFYSPEGDLIELHDTAQYEMQLLDSGKVIHDENVTRHYVVVMTPGADRWVIRQLFAVPQF